MITYYNHPHMTAVPTRLLLDTNLSAAFCGARRQPVR